MTRRLENAQNLYLEGIRDGKAREAVTLCRASWEGQPFAQVDIFRIEDGQVVEHWDNAEPVPPQEEWSNSGKF